MQTVTSTPLVPQEKQSHKAAEENSQHLPIGLVVAVQQAAGLRLISSLNQPTEMPFHMAQHMLLSPLP